MHITNFINGHILSYMCFVYYACMLLYSHNLPSRAAYFHRNLGDSHLTQDNTTGDALV